jgi:N-acetylglucosamine-6-phosphate deacetylase
VLPDRILNPGTLVIEGGRIAEIRPGTAGGPSDADSALHGHYVVPGFVDVHVHGVEGFDTLDRPDRGNPVAAIAARLPKYGVTAFCPTTVACAPDALRRMLDHVGAARTAPAPGAARVLPAHLESNFINPEFRGAQPLSCLRSPAHALAGQNAETGPGFTGADLVAEIERGRGDVGIVTLASELDGGLDLLRWLVGQGLRASVGHSGATYEQGLDAVAAGARHATHLFNRMPPLGHRAPGLAGAVLQSDAIAAELICDGCHVHPAVIRMAVATKRPARIMAITDGTAVSGLPEGSRAALGGQSIVAGKTTALLDDGTLAGSILTMDRAFRTLVRTAGFSIADAATMCATTAARELGVPGGGVLAEDAVADLVVLDAELSVARTYVEGRLVYARDQAPT